MVSDKIKALLSMKGKKYNELATLFDISPQAMRNKFVRGSFSADELIMIADFLDCQLAFEVDNEQKIILTVDDIRKRYGSFSIQKGCLLTDENLSSFRPKDEGVINVTPHKLQD